MEPLFFKAENSDEEEDMACDCDASMEPLFFKAENICSTQGEFTRLIELQWSRFFSKRKMSGGIVNMAKAYVYASMEPLFFKAENKWKGKTVGRLTCRFNGAAFFQSGKYSPRRG